MKATLDTSMLIPLLYWESSSSLGPAWWPHKYHFTSSCPSESTARGQPQSHLSSKAKTPPHQEDTGPNTCRGTCKNKSNANLSGARGCSRALSESVWQSACMMTICYRNTLLFLRKKICGCFPLWEPPPKEGRCVNSALSTTQTTAQPESTFWFQNKGAHSKCKLFNNQHFFKLTLASPFFSR